MKFINENEINVNWGHNNVKAEMKIFTINRDF
jgi:hypothetical protein